MRCGKVLIVYIKVGDQLIDKNMLEEFVKAGVDILELGILQTWLDAMEQ